MLYKNARKAFTDALLSEKIFGHVGSVGPVTEFTPQARRSLPPRMCGTSSDVRAYGEEIENMITAAAAYHARLDTLTLSSSRSPSIFDTALQEAAGTPEQQPRWTRDQRLEELTRHPEGQAMGRPTERQEQDHRKDRSQSMAPRKRHLKLSLSRVARKSRHGTRKRSSEAAPNTRKG